MVSNWQPTPSLVEVAVSGAEIAPAPCLPTLAVTHLPLCLQRGRAISGSGLALFWYSLGHNPLFCESARGHSALLEPSCRKGPLFLFQAFPLFERLCHISTLRVSSGHSTTVLTLMSDDAATSALSPSLHLLPADAFLLFTFFFFFFYAAL